MNPLNLQQLSMLSFMRMLWGGRPLTAEEIARGESYAWTAA